MSSEEVAQYREGIKVIIGGGLLCLVFWVLWIEGDWVNELLDWVLDILLFVFEV